MRRYLFFVSQLYALAILRPLQQAIRDRGDEAAWFVEGSAGRYLRPGERRFSSVEQVKRYEPRAVFAPGNWLPDFFPGIKVELFHGFNVQKRSDRKGHFRIRGFFDLYCTQGPSTTEPFNRLAEKHGYFRVEETGWPKMDPLFAANPGGEPAGDGRPTVLYASTFNRPLSSAALLCDTIAGLARKGEWRWLVTFHPKMPPEVVSRYARLESELVRFVETDDVIPLLRAADVMLSDTSSIVSEFLLLGKPVVTFRNRVPGPQLLDVGDPAELEPALRKALGRPPELLEAIRRYADRIHPYRDGRSSERVLDATERFLERGREGLARKPLNLWRRIQARRRLGYYRFR